MNKQILYTLTQLKNIPLRDRYKYYFHDDLVATMKKFSNNDEQLISVEKISNCPFILEPFWNDSPHQVKDTQLQKLLNMEGEEFKKYLIKHPDFKVTIRQDVYKKLVKAQRNLPHNIKIVLKAGYRPISVQKALFKQVLIFFKNKFPKLSSSEIYKMNLEFVADADNYIAPHSTGAAIDILLHDTNSKKDVDMGSPINFPDDKSWTFNNQTLTHKQIMNRKLLTDTMLAVGFANLASEWWHYSYGDQYWALFYNRPVALYNSITE